MVVAICILSALCMALVLFVLVIISRAQATIEQGNAHRRYVEGRCRDYYRDLRAARARVAHYKKRCRELRMTLRELRKQEPDAD